MAPVPARQCAWMHRMCHTHTHTKKHGATNQQQTSLTKHQLPSKFCLLKVHLVRRLCVCVWGWARASVRSRSIYQQHARERRLLLRIPHSGCPAAARPNMNTQVRQRQRPAESRNRSDEPTGRLFFFFFQFFYPKCREVKQRAIPAWARGGERERGRERDGRLHRVEFRCVRRMFCGTGFLTPPLLPSPFLWLMITRQQTQTTPHHHHHHHHAHTHTTQPQFLHPPLTLHFQLGSVTCLNAAGRYTNVGDTKLITNPEKRGSSSRCPTLR